MKERAWWVRLPDGSRRRLSPGGILIGRDPDSDIVLTSPHASRKHAMMYVCGDGPQVVGLGRGSTEIGGQALASVAPVDDGDVIDIPGLRLVVQSEELPPEDAADPTWVVEVIGGNLFGVGPQGVSVGSGASDDVQIEGWPPGAVFLRLVQGRLVLETKTEIALRGEVLSPDSIESLRSGDLLGLGAVQLRVVAGGYVGLATTVGMGDSAEASYPSVVRLAFMPRGGRLTVNVDGKEYSTYLSDRRCDLVACLLQPPAPFAPGDAIPEDVVMGRVWPRRDIGPSAFYVLLHRIRRDLVNAGMDGGELIARAPGGGALRFSLRRGAVVEVT